LGALELKVFALPQAVLLVLLTFALMWPALMTGRPLITDDTATYYRGGGVAMDLLEKRLGLDREIPAPVAAEATLEDSVTEVKRSSEPPIIGLRSLAYSLFTNLSMRTLGVMAPVVITCAATAWLILLFVETFPLIWRAGIGFGVAGLTLLPFYVSQIMPDIFAGIMILVAMIFATRPDLSTGYRWVLLGIMYLAILTHYAHIPLGFMLCAALLALYLWRRERGVALLVLGPILLALASNVVISLMVPADPQLPDMADAASTPHDQLSDKQLSEEQPSEGPQISIAPARYPFLLARSLEDGPAHRFLSENCPDPRFTICEIYDEFPSNAGAALWGPDSIYNRANLEQARRIADEEVHLVWAAFRAYPFEQVRALAANTWAQFVRFGYPPVAAANIVIQDSRELQIERSDVIDWSKRTWFERIQLAALGLSILMVALNYRAMSGGFRFTVWLVLLSLVVNAMVCGGLSAPVDRYQGRIIWCVVLLGFTAWAIRPTFGFGRTESASSNA
jgi:hypothetical protein